MAVVQFGAEDEATISKPVQRMRWATQRRTGAGGSRKRRSIMDRLHRRTSSKEEKRKSTTSPLPHPEESAVDEASVDSSNIRRIFCNVPLPEDVKDENGRLIANYSRNKIRTAKYTPLSFIPKNLWFQFHNVANIYFLFTIILSIFPIFGATSPGLSAVPLISILTITAIKDAIEDWRRTILDTELNNSPIHRLVEWTNVNSIEDNVSLWRRIKKATSRAVMKLWHVIIAFKKGGKLEVPEEDILNGQRPSIDTRRTKRDSTYSFRQSFQQNTYHSHEENGAIQMTPVPSPNPDKRNAQMDGQSSGMLRSSSDYLSPEPPQASDHAHVRNEYGSVLNKSRQTPQTARFKRDYWKNVQVGDFVRIYNEEPIPADVVVLSTSDPDGACYVETKNLDGETNLKVRQALHCTRDVKHARDCEKAQFTIESESPHPNLYEYNGAIKWMQHDVNTPDGPGREMVEPITINNILLRGCSIQNTEWVLGMVVFTGLQTKIMLNSGATPTKRARIARGLNWNVIYNFVILFLMCLVSGIVQGITWGQGKNSLDLFEFGSYGGSPPVDGFVTFWAAVILYQSLVPISLYISLEIVRTAQAIFIHSDTFMYYDKLGYPCTPKSWNISDDLGQIEYIFSDKTGTLTQNVMEFKKCTINGVSYGEAYTEAMAGMQRREGIDVEEVSKKANEAIAKSRVQMLQQLRSIHDNPYLRDENLTFVSPEFVSHLSGSAGEEQRAANEHFMLALALCHTVITERTPGDPPKLEFKAQSPDEAALVATARDCGFTVLGRSGDDIRLNIMGEERLYTVLNTLEFNSSRKRMSAIIRMPDGRIILFCKGADSIIYSRLTRGQQQELRKSTAGHLEMFAREGLRTLCIAERVLSEEEYREWKRSHDLAAQSLTDRDVKLEETSSAIEQELTLLGGTAIEDRLQDGVPDTISLLATAGIKLWVLTGDKVETAINIGFSCNLLSNEMDLIVFNIDKDDPDSATYELDTNLAKFGLTGSDEELIAAQSNHEPPAPTHALIVDGDTLKLMLSPELKQKFLLLCKQCKSVLCCRVSPAQKAAVVQMVKTGLNVMALAIGDGANDVAMIQEADVGVGIAGEEGRQAVMSSDYAIGQFRFLQRLVLVHGRWSYRRLGETVANFFYKNLVWTFALFWYSIYNNFDCSYLFDFTYIILVNLAFTSLPVILMGILDQDVDDKVSLAVPQLYKTGIEQKEWTQKKFWLYMLDGFYQSLMCFFMTYLLYRPATGVTDNGLDLSDRNRMGVFVACSAVTASNTYILLNTYRWDWLTVLINAISSLLIFFWTGVYTSVDSSGQFYRAGREVFGTLTFWALTFLTVTMCLCPRFTIKSIQKIYFPKDVDIVREQVVAGNFKYLDEYEAYVPPTARDLSPASTDLGKIDVSTKRPKSVPEDERPIYPPSVAPTATTHNPRSQNGSDGTGYTASLEFRHHQQQSIDHGTSYDRVRRSMDPVRSSFEVTRDFTSAAMLSRMESTHED
ncbi:phospholipid-translocating P-type ATPase domain-containing protein [Histoplasma capsulatum G186AR]|uniref:Phospholipid-transporting ATPase n=2 Tax=Ajellomyces capsulatus TaxID=5037 RepID=C0NQ71_AJECG|nr:phospholipid-translocating P-type ATPase domain-containing protein [Histoplasma capsulatum G186AR]EEH06343.1 phospholipid-translocating P-type ATPase domain-containing protein [Histoplasma capsulatum G186AR]KAG5293198.1 phospholipid-translocating P-type ATPase domain-containing protein [Histoplasma capsulatum]QSS74648.1 phospholipid-translocating P-type ATPase domain-containing protein [Histoplasma capsulatum G186AR]